MRHLLGAALLAIAIAACGDTKLPGALSHAFEFVPTFDPLPAIKAK